MIGLNKYEKVMGQDCICTISLLKILSITPLSPLYS